MGVPVSIEMRSIASRRIEHCAVRLRALDCFNPYQIDTCSKIGGNNSTAAVDSCGLYSAPSHIEDGYHSSSDVIAHRYIHHAINTEDVRTDVACNVSTDANGHHAEMQREAVAYVA